MGRPKKNQSKRKKSQVDNEIEFIRTIEADPADQNGT